MNNSKLLKRIQIQSTVIILLIFYLYSWVLILIKNLIKIKSLCLKQDYDPSIYTKFNLKFLF